RRGPAGRAAGPRAATLAGPPVAGLLIAAAGVVPVFAANAASFAASALLLSRLPRERLQRARRDHGGRLDLGAGLAIYRTPALRGLLASWGFAQFTWVSINVGEIL